MIEDSEILLIKNILGPPDHRVVLRIGKSVVAFEGEGVYASETMKYFWEEREIMKTESLLLKDIFGHYGSYKDMYLDDFRSVEDLKFNSVVQEWLKETPDPERMFNRMIDWIQSVRQDGSTR